MEAFVFFVSAAVVLAGGAGVILSRNPVHAALSLVATLFGVAIQFISLEAYFLAAVQVIVYAGAIVVLFLFVIMLLGVDRSEDIVAEPLIGQRQLALLAGAGLVALAVVIGLATSADVTGQPTVRAELPPSQGGLAIDQAIEAEDGTTIPPEQNIREVGRALFSTRYVFAFEITAILLTVAVVGAVVLARRPRGELEEIPDVEPPWNMRPLPDPDEEPGGIGTEGSEEAAESAEGSDEGAESAEGSDDPAEGADGADAEVTGAAGQAS
jgi:NADH-quinone oxidoreductase subunit J